MDGLGTDDAVYEGQERACYVSADSAATALEWGIRIQVRIGEQRAELKEAVKEELGPRLQCGIVISRKHPKIRGISKIRKAEPDGTPEDAFGPRAKREVDSLLERLVAGQVICSADVYDDLKRGDVPDYYAWQRLLIQDLKEYSFKDTIWRGLTAAVRTINARKHPPPWECLYEDRQSLLDGPFESVFADEIRYWVKPSRNKRGKEPEILLP